MSTEISQDVKGPVMKSPVPTTKQELLALIEQAAAGDQKLVERLLTPFLTSGERIIWAGLTAKMGLITTYNFGFLTDRRVGDLQVTPWTGDLNVEVCYLQHIDATVISQPAINLVLWTWVALGYPMCIFLGFVFSFFTIGPITEFRGHLSWILCMVAWAVLSILFIVGWTLFGIPMMRRWTLLRRKSGIWFKLRGSEIGSLMFSDRDKFAILTALARMVTEQKRLLDRETQ